jgi:hypothetical protein
MTELDTYPDVVEQLRRGMKKVRYLRPPPKPRPRRRAFHLAAAIALVGATALISTVLLSRSGTSLVWAAEPDVVTEADIGSATASCQESLDAQDPSLDIRVGDLPPLALMDLRGNRAVAIFRGGGEYIVCLLDTSAVPWRASIFSAAPYGTEETGSPPLGENAQVLDSGTWGEGDDMVTLVAGAVPSSVSRVIFEFKTPDLGSAEASVGEGAFCIWWPGGPSFDVDIRAYAADGTELHQPIGGIRWGEASPAPSG